MNLQQILQEIKQVVPPPADVTDEQIVLKINQIQRKLFRELTLPDKAKRFQSTPDSPYYDLPDDCGEDRIKTVLVDNQEYVKVSNQESDAPPRFCTVFIDKLYIYPNPTAVTDILLYYRPRYRDLSAGEIGRVPDLPEDYHELLVFGGAHWVASLLKDVDMVNNMQAEYDELFQAAKRQFKQFTSKRVRIKEVW